MKPKRSYAADSTKSNAYDRCQTPPYAVDPLLPYLSKFTTIWEPAAGDGYIVRKLQQEGLSVVQSDILTGQDFFKWTPDCFDAIVTNPPYSDKYKWLERCYLLGKPFALLIPVETIGAEKAQKLFSRYGVEVIWLSPRVAFKMPTKTFEESSPQFPTAWFTFGFGIGKENSFVRLTKYSENQLHLEGGIGNG